MSNVIDFLERMGASSALRTANPDQLAKELTAASVDAELAAAILAGDDASLRARLAPGKFYSIQLDETEESEAPEEPNQEPEDGEASIRFALHGA